MKMRSRTGTSSRPTLEDLLVARADDGPAVREAIHNLAGILGPGGHFGYELETLADRIGAATRLGEETRPERVLATLTGNEVLLAACVAAIGQAAGFKVDVVVGRRRAVIAHEDATFPLAISLRHEGRIVDPTDFGEDLHWACPHEVESRIFAPAA